MERTVCQGVEARQTVSCSGVGVSGIPVGIIGRRFGCKLFTIKDEYPLSSPIIRH